MGLLSERLKDSITVFGWKIPSKDGDGIFTSEEIDEESISCLSEGYTGEASNSKASGFWARERANAFRIYSKKMVQKHFGRLALGMEMRPSPFVTEELKFLR